MVFVHEPGRVSIAIARAPSYRFNGSPYDESYCFGFRVASEVPEPATLSLLALGGVALLRKRRGSGRRCNENLVTDSI